MRHGKSDWDAEYDRDHDRPLNDRGVRSARTMGRVLTDLGLAPDLVISSTAVRAHITAELAADAGGWTGRIELEPRFYGGSPEDVLDVLATSASGQSRIMVVGHQPTWGLLVHNVTGSLVEMKTASVAVIELSAGEWSKAREARGLLVGVHHPRTYLVDGPGTDGVP